VAREFVGRFRNQFGMTGCRELIGDLVCQATPEAEERRKARCQQYTMHAIRQCIDTLLKQRAQAPSQG
jgi:hypothetical protein